MTTHDAEFEDPPLGDVRLWYTGLTVIHPESERPPRDIPPKGCVYITTDTGFRVLAKLMSYSLEEEQDCYFGRVQTPPRKIVDLKAMIL